MSTLTARTSANCDHEGCDLSAAKWYGVGLDRVGHCVPHHDEYMLSVRARLRGGIPRSAPGDDEAARERLRLKAESDAAIAKETARSFAEIAENERKAAVERRSKLEIKNRSITAIVHPGNEPIRRAPPVVRATPKPPPPAPPPPPKLPPVQRTTPPPAAAVSIPKLNTISVPPRPLPPPPPRPPERKIPMDTGSQADSPRHQ
jgi:hypothetical protein